MHPVTSGLLLDPFLQEFAALRSVLQSHSAVLTRPGLIPDRLRFRGSFRRVRKESTSRSVERGEKLRFDVGGMWWSLALDRTFLSSEECVLCGNCALFCAVWRKKKKKLAALKFFAVVMLVIGTYVSFSVAFTLHLPSFKVE